MQFEIVTYEEIDSTNTAIKQAIRDGVPEGLVIVSKKQRQGRGRQGRTWLSPEGGLYASILLRPQERDRSTLSLVIGMAILDVITQYVPKARLKWPNDIVIEDHPSECDSSSNTSHPVPIFQYRKICGILCEATSDGVCIGFGVNLEPSEMQTFSEAASPAFMQEICDCDCPSPMQLLAEILESFEIRYRNWSSRGFSSMSHECSEANILKGRNVVALNADGEIVASGIAGTINIAGELELLGASGATRFIRSGEVHLLH